MLQFLFVLTEGLLYNLIKVFIGSCFNTCKDSCFNVMQEYYDTSLAGSKQKATAGSIGRYDKQRFDMVKSVTKKK